MTSLFKLSLTAALLFTPLQAYAQETFETATIGDAVEIEQDEELEVETIVNGDVTGIRPAALVFATFDTNGDYSVDTRELAAGHARAFGHADRDTSGYLSIIEIEGWRRNALGSTDAIPGRMAFDPNLDNRITKDEFGAEFTRLFRESDKNQDGKLDFAEMVDVFDMPKRRSRNERDRERDLSRIGREDPTQRRRR